MGRASKLFSAITTATTGGGAFAVGALLGVLEHLGLKFPEWAWVAYGVLAVLILVTCIFAWIWMAWEFWFSNHAVMRKADIHRRRLSENFRLGEAACWIADVDVQIPVPPGIPFLALEGMRNAIWAGVMKMNLPPLERALFDLERQNKLAGLPCDYEIDESKLISRQELKAHVEREGFKLKGIN